MESVGLIRTLVFVIVMFAITVLPFIVILGAVYLLRRSMSKKQAAHTGVDIDDRDEPASE